MNRTEILGHFIKSTKRGIPTQYLNDKYEGSTEGIGSNDNIKRVIGIGSIKEGVIDTNNVDTVRVENGDAVKKATVETGDLILTLRGSSIKAAVADPSVEGYVISANLIAIKLTENVKPEIIATYLNGPIGQSELTKWAGGTCMFSLNLGRLREVLIPIRSMEEQEELIRFLELSRKYKMNLVKELELWDSMTESFIVQRLGI